MRIRLWAPAVLVFALVFAPVLAPTLARADEETRPFKQLVREALEEYQLGHHAEALALFRRAHEVQPSARTFRGMGLTAFEAGQYVFAIECLEAALADKRKPLTPAMRRDAEALAQRGETFVSLLELSVEPGDAHISLNGDARTLDAAGAALRLDPGTYELVVSAAGHQTERRHIELLPGARQALSVRLPAEVQAAAASSQAHGAPADAVAASEIDGAQTPLVVKVTAIGGLSLAVLGATVGSIAGLSVLSEADALEAACPGGGCPPAQGARLDDAQGMATLSTASFVVAGVGLAVGVVGTVLWATGSADRPSGEASPQSRLSAAKGGMLVRF